MKKYYSLLILLVLCSTFMEGQVRSNKYSYSNLKGVTRIGVFIPYQMDWSEGLGIDYTVIGKHKSFVNYALYYAALDKSTEEITKFNLSMNFGKHLFNLGKSNYARGIFGFEAGWEWKESKVITDKSDFFYGGINIAFENEFFISQHIIIPIGIKQSGHFYLKNVRTFTTAYAGIRFTFN